MSSIPVPINATDLASFLRDNLEPNTAIEEWVAQTGLDPQALADFGRWLAERWKESEQNPATAVLVGFQLGWDAHRHFRGERE